MNARTRLGRAVPGVLVISALVALLPLAYASPPDQTWIGGWYDDGDHDDVVVLATSTAVAFTHGAPPPRPALVVVAHVAPAALSSLPTSSPLGTPCRAPPAV